MTCFPILFFPWLSDLYSIWCHSGVSIWLMCSHSEINPHQWSFFFIKSVWFLYWDTVKHSFIRLHICFPPANSSTILSPLLSYGSASSASIESSSSVDSSASTDKLRRVGSNTSISGLMAFNNVYLSVWRALLQLAADPYPDVADMAKKIVNSVKIRVRESVIKVLSSE